VHLPLLEQNHFTGFTIQFGKSFTYLRMLKIFLHLIIKRNFWRKMLTTILSALRPHLKLFRKFPYIYSSFKNFRPTKLPLGKLIILLHFKFFDWTFLKKYPNTHAIILFNMFLQTFEKPNNAGYFLSDSAFT